MSDEFAPWERAVELLTDRGPYAPAESSRYVLEAVRTNRVRLLDKNSDALRWERTPEARKEIDAEQDQLAILRRRREASKGTRYNPLGRREREASNQPAPSRGAIPASAPTSDGVSILPYLVHLRDLQEVLYEGGRLRSHVDLLSQVSQDDRETSEPDVASKKSSAGRKRSFDHEAVIDDLFEYMAHEDHSKLTEAAAIEWVYERWPKYSKQSEPAARSTLQPVLQKAFAKFDAWTARNFPDKGAGN